MRLIRCGGPPRDAFHGAARGQIPSTQGGAEDAERRDGEGGRIRWANAEQQPLDDAPRHERTCKPDGQPDGGEPKRIADDARSDPSGRCADGHQHANLARAMPDDERQHTIDADSAENRRPDTSQLSIARK
jgi:hypothetical protein